MTEPGTHNDSIGTGSNTGTEPLYYTGVWERKGRSAVAAAFIVLFGIGTLYFTGSNILSIPIFIFMGALGGVAPEDMTFVERISHVFRQLALPVQVLLVIAQFAFLLIPTIILTRKLHTDRVKEYLRFRAAPVGDIALAILITIVMMPFTNFIANEITRWFDIPEWFANLGIELFTAHSLPEFIWLAFVIGVTPAICEEVLFRGYAQRTLERKMGAKSVWIIGVIFGLYHFNPLGLISLSIMGVVFGFFFYRSKSILPSMAAHFTNNFLVVYLLYAGLDIGGVDIAAMESIPFWVAGISGGLSAALLYLYFIMTRQRSDPFPDEEPVAQTAAILPTMP